MTPPPPPSPSYLLAIDTDSEESSKEEEDSSPTSFEDDAYSKEQEPQTTTPQQKKKKKRKKKRKKSKSIESSSEDGPRRVHFGDVSVREHERCLGDGVPLDGGWPLGISHNVIDEYQVAASVDEFEERKQRELRDRWFQVINRYAASNEQEDGKDSSDALQPPLIPPAGVLETRQFDYSKRVHEITKSTKNPLFGPLNEEERMRLLVLNDSADDDSVRSSDHSVQKSPGKPLAGKQTRRSRSNSMQHHSSDTSVTRSPGRHTRRARSNSEQYFSDAYPSTDVLHVRNELEQIRVHRSLEGSIGCGCRKLDVYLPPPDGGGKKAQHRRMNLQKVKDELRKRGKLPPKDQQCTRAELEQLLHDVVQQEPCCWGEDCFCVRNGIGCQAEACSCWFESHQRKGHNNTVVDESPSVEVIRERCGNNMYAVDLDAIHEFRLQYCQVIDTN